MTLYDFLATIPSFIWVLIITLLFLILYSLIKNATIKITNGSFNLKKTDNAMIIEKIIEIAYDISNLNSTKKMKLQMSYFEKKVNEILNEAIKDFREMLLKELELPPENIFSLENEDDIITFKNGIEVVKLNWREFSRSFFREEFTDLKEINYDELKEDFVSNLEKIRIETLNTYYRDTVYGYTRKIKRNDIYKMFKENEVKINLMFFDAINNAIAVIKSLELEKKAKLKELEDFIKKA